MEWQDGPPMCINTTPTGALTAASYSTRVVPRRRSTQSLPTRHHRAGRAFCAAAPLPEVLTPFCSSGNRWPGHRTSSSSCKPQNVYLGPTTLVELCALILKGNAGDVASHLEGECTCNRINEESLAKPSIGREMKTSGSHSSTSSGTLLGRGGSSLLHLCDISSRSSPLPWSRVYSS